MRGKGTGVGKNEDCRAAAKTLQAPSRLPVCKRFPDVCVSQGRRWTDVSGVRLRKETVGESIWVRVGIFIETLVEAVETAFYVFEEIK